MMEAEPAAGTSVIDRWTSVADAASPSIVLLDHSLIEKFTDKRSNDLGICPIGM
jgi:hypothetical protein